MFDRCDRIILLIMIYHSYLQRYRKNSQWNWRKSQSLFVFGIWISYLFNYVIHLWMEIGTRFSIIHSDCNNSELNHYKSE